MNPVCRGKLRKPPITGQQLQSASALLVVTIVTLGASCRGFFVNPQLTSLTVSPSSVTVTKSQTVSLVATGSYSDGSTKNLTARVSWTSSDPSCAKVSTIGTVTAGDVSNSCTTTVTATATGSSPLVATSAVSVQPGFLTSITLSASATAIPAGSTVMFKAMGTYSEGSQQQDVTSLVTWDVTNTTVLTMTQGTGSGIVSSSATSGSTSTVTARLSGVISNGVTITVR